MATPAVVGEAVRTFSRLFPLPFAFSCAFARALLRILRKGVRGIVPIRLFRLKSLCDAL